MAAKLLSTDEFRATARDGVAPGGASVFLLSTTSPQVLAAADRTVRFVFSTEDVDLAGDVIKQSGWDVNGYLRNPIVPWCHDTTSLPIGRSKNVGVVNGKLMGDVEFVDAETYPFADVVYRLVAGKWLRGCSVGFLPLRWSFPAGDKNRPNGINFLEQRLLELSICALPANPNSLSQARSAGVNTGPLVEWAERILDGGVSSMMPRRAVEDLRTQASSTAAPKHYTAKPETREQRMRHAEELRRSLQRPAQTPAERRVEAGNIKRQLRAAGLL